VDGSGLFTIQAPWLVIDKTGPTEPIPAGTENVGYVIQYHNVGNTDARDVRITETYDSNVSFSVAVPSPDDGTDDRVWSVSNVEPNDPPQTIYVFVDVASSLAPNTVLTNVVDIGGPRLQTVTALVTTVVTSTPDLTVLLSDLWYDPVDAGESFPVQVRYRNDGSAPVHGIVLTLTLDAHVTIQQAGVAPVVTPTAANGNVGRWELGTLSAGGEESFYVWLEVDDFMLDQSILTNRARIHSDETVSAYDTELTTVNAPELALTKSAALDPAPAFNALTYTMRYTNVGHAATSGLYVTDAVPERTLFKSCAPSPCSLDTGAVIWQPGDIGPGVSGSVQLVVEVDRNLDSGTTLTNTAVIYMLDTPAYSATAEITTSVISSPSLAVSISNGTDAIHAGDVLDYVVDYRNTGNGKAYGTKVVVNPPAPVLTGLISCSPADQCMLYNGQVIYDFGTVSGGQSGSVHMIVNMKDPLPAGLHTVLASASISTETPGDPPAGNSAHDSDPVVTRPDLWVTVDYEDIKPYPGKRVTYTVRYGNEAHIATTGVVVTATQPEYTTFESDGSHPGWEPLGNGHYRLEVGNLTYAEGGELLFVVSLTSTYFFSLPVTRFDAGFGVHDSGISGTDADLGNNRLVAQIGVPNLIITDVAADPGIWFGETGYLTVTVQNTGLGPAFRTVGPIAGFYLDLFLDPPRFSPPPSLPPPSYPISDLGDCFVFMTPVPAELTATVVISFTTLSQWYSGLCGAGRIDRMWLKIDNWGTRADLAKAPEYAFVPESDEYDNVFGPVYPPSHLYLPLVVKE
jgi:hypothetical protein